MNHSTRRTFLKMAGVAGLGTLGGLHGMALAQTDLKRLTILHTNDTHSRIDPFPANDPGYPGMGGYARRAALINQFRQSDPELLLLDAGDFFQGTPYFNKYGGETELVLMSHLGYDAATLGNHEFDNGLEGLLHVLPHARFPFVCSNYDFSDTVLRDKTLPYLVLERNGVSVGIYGLGISLDGLVARHHFGNTVVLDPIEVAREMESTLKRKGCDLILCISHLGFRYEHDRVSDYILAGHTRETDIIIGGHTHRRLDPAEVVRNESGREVTIGQAGSAGVFLGRMVVYFEPDTGEKLVESNTTNISKNQVV